VPRTAPYGTSADLSAVVTGSVTICRRFAPHKFSSAPCNIVILFLRPGSAPAAIRFSREFSFPNSIIHINSFLHLFFSLDTLVTAAQGYLPRLFAPSRIETTMSQYCLQISFTNQAWSRLAHTPQDRFAVVHAPLEKLGGSIQATFFTTGRFDLLAIAEFPDRVTPAEISVAFAHGGAVASINTSPLLNFAQAVEARNKELAAASCTIRTQRHMVAVAGS
jgi:uncharacterized protein with GYD domain